MAGTPGVSRTLSIDVFEFGSFISLGAPIKTSLRKTTPSAAFTFKATDKQEYLSRAEA